MYRVKGISVELDVDAKTDNLCLGPFGASATQSSRLLRLSRAVGATPVTAGFDLAGLIARIGVVKKRPGLTRAPTT